MDSFLAIFLILLLGYLLGSVKIKGLSLGTSGILLVALVFGHFGVEIPSVVRNFGLAIFVGSVGMIAGPVFFSQFQKEGLRLPDAGRHDRGGGRPCYGGSG